MWRSKYLVVLHLVLMLIDIHGTWVPFGSIVSFSDVAHMLCRVLVLLLLTETWELIPARAVEDKDDDANANGCKNVEYSGIVLVALILIAFIIIVVVPMPAATARHVDSKKSFATLATLAAALGTGTPTA